MKLNLMTRRYNPFEGQELVAFSIPEEWRAEVPDVDAGDSSDFYYFAITDHNTVAIDNFEDHYPNIDPSVIREVFGYSDLEATFGSFIATQMYQGAIQQYYEQRISYSETQQSATVPELQTTTNEIKHEVVQGDNPGLAIYYQRIDPKGEVSNFRYFYPDITDRNAIDSANLRYREEPLTGSGSGTQSLLRITERMIDGNWIHATTTELRNYGNFTVIKESPADDPDHFDLDVAINFGSESEHSLFSSGVTAGAIGAQLGSSVGNFISGDEIWKQLTISPLLSTVGENLAEAVAINAVQNSGDLSDDVLDVFNNADTEFLGHLRDAAGGAISSLVTAELMRTIDAEGLGADLAATVSSAVLGKISNNLITMGVNELTGGATTAALGNTTNLLSGVNINLVGNAVGGFIGSKLAEQALAGYDSEEEAIGAQIGGAAAGAATLFLVTSGPVGWLIAGLSSFAGNFLGGTLGDLIHSARPEKASAQLVFNSDTGEFEIGRTWRKRGGNIDGVKAIANVAGDAMGNVLDIVGGEVLEGDDFSGIFLWKESRNIHGPGYFERGTYFENVGGFGVWHNSVEDFNAVVETGVIDMLGRLKIAGGDLYYKRALYNSLSTLMDEHQHPIEDPLQALSGNLQIATEYSNYLKNKEVINALIQAQPDSVFAAGWIATLARAAELGLNRRHASDFYGGWRYLLEQTEADLTQSRLDYSNNQRLIGLQNGHGGVVLGDCVDPDSKTVIQGSGVIDLRESTRELLSHLQRDGDLLIDTRNQLSDVIAEIGDDGSLILTDKYEVLDGAKLEDGELIRQGNVIARVNEDGDFVPIHGEDIAVSAVVNGSEEADIIYSGDLGNDIFAGGGNDTVHGGANADWIYGGEGDDTLHAGDTDGNALFGEAGNDELRGGASSDWLEGGEGDDRLYGGEGGDVLQGNGGNDYLEGGLGGDHYVIRRGDGNTVIADHGDVSENQPPLRLSDGEDSSGDNHDTLSFAASITLNDLTYERLEDDLVIQIAGEDETQETITLTDWFTDEGRIEMLEFASGIQIPITRIEQFINGTAGEDLLTLEEVGGYGLINALAGDDTIDLREAQASAVDGHLPIEDIISDLPNQLDDLPFGSVAEIITTLPNDEARSQEPGHVVNGGDGNDTVHGSAAGDILLGGQGADLLEGGGGDDTLLGGEESDNLAGGQGDDTLLGDTGDDELSGGAGADYIWGGSGEDRINGGAGSDTFEFGYGDGQDSLNDSHQYEPDDPDLTTLLASIDGLLTDETIADGTTTDEIPAGLIITDETNIDNAVSGEPITDNLLSLMEDLKAKLDAGSGDHAERIAESLKYLTEQLEANKLQMDRERLKPFIREFRYLALDSAGLLDIVNWTDGVEVGDLTIAWDDDDLTLELQNEYTEVAPETQQSEDQTTPADEQQPDTPGEEDGNDTKPDRLRLQDWGSTAPYIERFDFTSGQIDVADIAQWIGGTEADDQLNGSDDHDWLTGGRGNDTLEGAAGDDVLNGNTGDDRLLGGAGEDLLNGGSGDDELVGGSGDDIINGGSGNDLLNGAAGADTFYGGEGTDRVSYANAEAGVHVYLDNGATRQVQRGLTGEVHEQLLGEGSAADRDALISELLDALPDSGALIREVADGLPLTETMKLTFTEALAAGQQETAIELLQGIFDSTSWILESEERTSLLETIELVTQESLPEETDIDTYWEQVAEGLPERGTLIDRISELVPSRKEQGERLAALITQGDRAGLVSTINSWFSSLYGEEAQTKADKILALLPEELPATRSPITNLETAAEVVETTDALFEFTSSGLNYGPEEEDTLGSFLESDADTLSDAQRLTPFDDLAVKLTGYIYLEAGYHDFTVTTNEGFTLSIGDSTFSEASGEEVSGDFETGFYHFELTYFDHQGEEELSVTSNSLAEGNILDANLFYTDPLQVDPRLIEQHDENGRSYLSYPETDEQGDYFENVENLIGSAHDDLLWGDASDNQLIGGEGADTLHGGLGNDDLQGGNGNDRYEFGRGDGQDIVHDSAGEDTLMLGEDIAPEQLWLSRDGDNLALSVIGTNDKLTIADWYSDENAQLETITSATGESLLNSQVESLVHAMSAFSPPDSADASFGLAQEEQNELSTLIAASWQ
ncbi:MAG: calcium-binding protein [Candidatus Thiodiazotropha sp.]